MNPDSSDHPVILYIAATSRSGSTILEHTLGSVSGIANCGELRRLADFYRGDPDTIRDDANRIGCTCGTAVRDCAFWQEVERLSGLELSEAGFSSSLDHLGRVLFKASVYLLGPSATRSLARIHRPFAAEIARADNCFRIYDAIARMTNASYIADSSKIAHQFLMLRVARPQRVRLVMLVRDGRAVSASMVRGERKKYFMGGKYANATDAAAHRAAVRSWMFSVLQIGFCYLCTPRLQRHFVRYEDLCREPDVEIERMTTRLQISAGIYGEPTWDASEHTIGGSPSRFAHGWGAIKANGEREGSTAPTRARSFGLMAGLLNRLLGYR